MNKILVPIDLSVSSSWGFYYAYELAAALDAELIVMHVYLPSSETSLFQEQLKFLNNTSHEEANKRKVEILAHLKAATQAPLSKPKHAVKISYVLDYGDKNEINYYAKLHNADLIVMGTHGTGKATNAIWGSTTNKVIEAAACPVMVIPEGTTFKMASKIAYATDYSSNDIEKIYQLARIASYTNSELHCVHVNLFIGDANTDSETAFKEKIKDSFPTTAITFTAWSAHSVEDGLDIFCRINNIDILATLTKDKSTWGNLFGSKGVSQKMATHKQLPLIVFHE